MFAGRYFGNRYYGRRYFGKAGAEPVAGGGTFGAKFMIYDDDEEEWFL